MIGELYPDSPENYEIKKIVKDLNQEYLSDNVSIPLLS
jgi:hypothetical protein